MLSRVITLTCQIFQNWMDKECDRSYDDEYIGREVRTLYENGWFTGEIIYFNMVLEKYLVEYADSSTELVDIEDFDDTTIIML